MFHALADKAHHSLRKIPACPSPKFAKTTIPVAHVQIAIMKDGMERAIRDS